MASLDDIPEVYKGFVTNDGVIDPFEIKRRSLSVALLPEGYFCEENGQKLERLLIAPKVEKIVAMGEGAIPFSMVTYEMSTYDVGDLIHDTGSGDYFIFPEGCTDFCYFFGWDDCLILADDQNKIENALQESLLSINDKFKLYADELSNDRIFWPRKIYDFYRKAGLIDR